MNAQQRRIERRQRVHRGKDVPDWLKPGSGPLKIAVKALLKLDRLTPARAKELLAKPWSQHHSLNRRLREMKELRVLAPSMACAEIPPAPVEPRPGRLARLWALFQQQLAMFRGAVTESA